MKYLFNTFLKGLFIFVCILGGAIYRNFISQVDIMPFSSDFLFALNKKGFAMKEINEVEYFDQLSQLLKEMYVDPIQIDEKFSLGAVQGMINYLKDPYSKVMDAKEYLQYKKNILGEFEGIGLELILQFSTEQKKMIEEKKIKDIFTFIPDLVVHSVLPNSPAEAAGFLAGDRIDRINDRWVFHTNLIKKLRKLSEEALTDKQKKQILVEERKKFNIEYKKAYMPFKAKKLLTEKDTGKIDVQWQSKNGQIKRRTFECQKIIISPLYKDKEIYKLRFLKNADKRLAEVLEKEKSITLDLRDGQISDFSSMQRCLELLVPKGHYGYLKTRVLKNLTPLTLNSGRKDKYQVKVLINEKSTSTAKIFATILKNYSHASCEGVIDPASLCWTELFELPEGAYIIPTSLYVSKLNSSKSMAVKI